MVYWTLDYFKILYNEYTASGVNVREFCRARGIKENRFYYWIKMLKSQALSALDTPREFIPINPGAVNRLAQTSIEVRKENTIPVKTQDIKITYPNGVILHLENGCDLDMLKYLIALKP